jgi:2-oxoglutarate dehydrogenase E2 component (dihydrolipoamide succinyltransferase)
MAQIEMVMPKMGESIMEGTIIKWLKKEGDRIEQDESALEVATDKVDTEVPSTHSGVISKILVQEGEVVGVGKAIAIITTGDESLNGQPGQRAQETVGEQKQEEVKQQAENIQTLEAAPVAKLDKPQSGRFYSPLVMNIAREENISMQELEYIPGTGSEGRVTKRDILNFLSTRGNAPKVEVKATQDEKPLQVVKPAVSLSGNTEIIEMDRLRKIIAQRMVESKRIAPHVTSFVEADVTNMVYWRNRVKQEFARKEGEAITFTPIFIEAVVKALKDYPMLNSSVDNDRIILKKDINIGVAVALSSGNLIVPVIKKADQLNLVGLTKKFNDIVKRARDNKLAPDEVTDGTYTISNVGSFGNVMGTPIIMQPQVGILALGAIQKKPAVVETPQGDAIAIRHMMYMSHSYDHRIIDGALGGMFVRKVADYLEAFDLNRKY